TPVSRDLSMPLRRFSSSREFNQIAQHPQMSPKLFEGQSYCEGVVLARLLYRLAHVPGRSPTALLKHILLRLEQLPELVTHSYFNQRLELDAIVPVILG